MATYSFVGQGGRVASGGVETLLGVVLGVDLVDVAHDEGACSRRD